MGRTLGEAFSGRAQRRGLDAFLRSIQFGVGRSGLGGVRADWLSGGGIGLVGGCCVSIREWGREIVVLGLG